MASDDTEAEVTIARLLRDPAMWEPASPAGLDRLLDGIEQANAAESEPPTVGVLDGRRRWATPFLGGIAAALLLVAAVVGFSRLGGPDGIEVTLAGTDLAPDAVAEVVVEETDIGTRLLLDVTDLEPPPDGYYYEAWLRTGPDVGVSAGTFHMRGGDGEIELWAGVLVEDYPLITVTLQEEASEDSSGVVVLKGMVEAAG